MTASRLVAPLIIATLGVTGSAALATAAPPSSASAEPSSAVRPSAVAAAGSTVDQCRLRISKVRVLDLQHDVGGVDRAFVKIGNSSTTTQSYSIPQTRNTLGTGEELFDGDALVALRVETAGPGTVLVGSGQVRCRDTTEDFVFDNGDARYKVRALVQVLP